MMEDISKFEKIYHIATEIVLSVLGLVGGILFRNESFYIATIIAIVILSVLEYVINKSLVVKLKELEVKLREIEVAPFKNAIENEINEKIEKLDDAIRRITQLVENAQNTLSEKKTDTTATLNVEFPLTPLHKHPEEHKI